MTTTHAATSAPIGARAQGGPPLWVLALAYTALMLVGVALSAGVPLPSDSAETVLAYQRGNADTLRLAAFFQFGSAMPLAIWAATAYRRLRMLGVTAPGTAIGFAGGLLAAGSLALGGLIGWTRAETADVADPALAKLLAQLAFAAGGVGYAVPFALLVAGVAVPGLILRLLPRALGWAGMVVAVIGVLGTGAILTPALDLALPVTRFGGALWLIAVGFLLPRTRQRRQPPA
jgi:hypothetical protein